MMPVLSVLLLSALPYTHAFARSDDNCKPLESPKKFPAVNALFDSAALVSQLSAHPNGATNEVFISINVKQTHADVIGPASSPANDSVAAIALGAMRKGAKDAPVSLRLKIQQQPTLTLTVERSVLCAPVSVDGKRLPDGPIKMAVVAVPRGSVPSAPTAMQQSQSITPRFRVSKDGEVVTVELGTGSGINKGDDVLRNEFMTYRFHPATLDGKPVEVWITGKRIDVIN